MQPDFSLYKLTHLLLLLYLGFNLAACVPAGFTGNKVGMHIDAALEFAIEHPLAWEKDRRLPYRSNQGTVVWTNPEHPEMRLIVTSIPAEKAQTDTDRLSSISQQYPGFELTMNRAETLPAGAATHAMGFTPRQNFDIYLLNSGDRNYAIIFIATAETMGQYQSVVGEMVESFLILPSEKAARP